MSRITLNIFHFFVCFTLRKQQQQGEHPNQMLEDRVRYSQQMKMSTLDPRVQNEKV